MKPDFKRAVYFRRKDGQGTKEWGSYISDDAAIRARDECYEQVQDATMVWAHRSDQSGALGTVLTRDL